MKTPTNNDNLKQLFNKAKADEQNLDDFEKDAMAGFNMLDSEKEAFDLKASLDNRINNELFYKKESHNPKVYWLAAAGLALIIGLSTLFILNDTNTIPNNNLAITDTKTENAPSVEGELKEEITAETIVSTEKAPAKEVAEKLVSEEKKGLLDDEAKEQKVEKEATKRMVVAPSQNNEQSNDGDFEQEKSGGKKENDKSGEGAYGGVSQTVIADNLAKTSSAKDKETNDLQTKGNVAKPVQSPKLAEMETSVKNEVVTGNTKSKDSNREDDSKNNIDQVDFASNTSSTNKADRKENRAKESAKKSKSKETKSASGPETYDYKPGAPATKAAEESEATNIPTEDKRDESAFINCYYPGGETAIIKDIKENLVAENLNQKFDVTLYVNEKKVVEKVEFINSYDLTKKQKEDVTKILKAINKFNFFMVPTKKSTFPFKVLYRP